MKQRQILITGGAGFIGSHLTEALLERGHRATVLDDLSTGSFRNLSRVEAHPGLRFIEGSVCRSDDVAAAMSGCDTVFHLAAAVGVDLVVRSPVWTIETNVHGTENVLNAAAAAGAKVFIASTSEVYGRSEAAAFNETDDLVIGPPNLGRWSYAASKLVDEFLALAFCRERGLPVMVTRFFNTVGPRQTGRYGMVLPRFVHAALRNEPLRVFGDGCQTRCFCHVADTVRALLALDSLEEPPPEPIFNIGTSCEISINDLAERVIRLCDSSSTIVHIPYEEAYEPGFEDMFRRVPDTTRLEEATGWRWQHSLESIITQLRAHADLQNATA